MLIEIEKRLIDANLNRIREGIRVLEDIARYILNDLSLATSLKTLRHRARIGDSKLLESLLQHRDIKNDILKTSTPSEKRRENLRDIVVANFKRSEESARVLEEILKLDSVNSSSCGASNSVLGMQFRTCGNFRTSTDSSLVESPKISTNTKATPQFLEFVSEAKQPSLRLRFCESQNLIENNAKTAESTLDSANQRQSTESLCEIFKAIRYDLYDIEIAYFKALEKIENKDEK